MYRFGSYPCLWLILGVLMEGITAKASAGISRASTTPAKRGAGEIKGAEHRQHSGPWNYSMLAISLVVLIFGFGILAVSHWAKTRRRRNERPQAANNANITNVEATPRGVKRYFSEDKDEPAEVDPMLPTRQTSVPQIRTPADSAPLKPGEIQIRWINGDISAILLHAKEDMV